MSYQDALDFIWNLVNFETTPPEQREPYTLARMHRLMERLGNPQAQLRAVHVAGTKGKGSTSAMIEAVLRAAGHRMGLFTSPHLHTPRERIQLRGEPISEEGFAALVARVRPHVEALGDVTTFEALTAMAFARFAELDVDIAVVEVGLGGRLDATNLLRPLVSVITPLGLEHTAVLGGTIEEIAAEKGGILKPGVPAVSATQPPAALVVLRLLAAERGIALVVAPERWVVTRNGASIEGQTFTLHGDSTHYERLHLPLLGAHQAHNAAVAVAALHALRTQGVTWDEAALRAGLADTRWPARVEVLHREPLVVADGAHTPESAAALIATLQEVLPGGWRRATLVLGTMRDKNLETLLPALHPLLDRVIVTRSQHPRAADPATLAAHPLLAPHAPRRALTVAEALVEALAEASPDDLIVATGSLAVAAEARAALGRGEPG